MSKKRRIKNEGGGSEDKAKAIVPSEIMPAARKVDAEDDGADSTVVVPEVLPAPGEGSEADLDVDAISVDDIVEVEPHLPDEPSSSKDVIPFDALTSYLREIRRYPRLTKEEEHALAVRYFKYKDVNAAYKLISSNLWLVVKIARDYEKAARSLLDLVQEGNIGLMEAIKNFDPFRNVRFPSYAVWWIKAYIVRYVIANWRLVKIGTTQAQRKLFFNLKKEKDRLEREGFYPAPKLLAEKLNVKESEVLEMEQRLSASDLSVDAPLDSESESDLLSILPSSSSSAEDIVASREMKELFIKSLNDFKETLNDKEKVILEERMLSEEKVTLQDIADKLDISRERVRQIETRIQEKLKEFLKDKLGSGLADLT